MMIHEYFNSKNFKLNFYSTLAKLHANIIQLFAY